MRTDANPLKLSSMNAQRLATTMTAQDFLVWEASQSERHDYFHGEIFAMAGGSDAHNTVTGNVFSAVRQHLKGSPCRAYTSDMRLQLAQGEHYVYPDVFVSCDARDKTSEASHTKQHAVFVMEVLSPSTADYDRGIKFDNYRDLADLQEILFIDPTRKTAELYRRSTAPEWVLIPAKLGDTLHLQSLGVVLAMVDVFDNVD